MMKMMFYTLMMKSMDGSNKLDFYKYKDRLKKVYPTLSEEKLEEIFILRVEFWEMIIENIEEIKK